MPGGVPHGQTRVSDVDLCNTDEVFLSHPSERDLQQTPDRGGVRSERTRTRLEVHDIFNALFRQPSNFGFNSRHQPLRRLVGGLKPQDFL